MGHFFYSLGNPAFIGYLISGVMAYGVMIAYNTMAPFLFQKTLGYSPSIYGWLTFLVAITYYAGTSTNRSLIRRLDHREVITIGLCLILLAGLAMIMMKLLFNLFNFYVVFIPILVATYAQALVWSNCIAGALKDLSEIIGSSAALFSCLQMILSATISYLLTIPVEVNQLPLGIAILLLGFFSTLSFKLFVFHKR